MTAAFRRTLNTGLLGPGVFYIRTAIQKLNNRDLGGILVILREVINSGLPQARTAGTAEHFHKQSPQKYQFQTHFKPGCNVKNQVFAKLRFVQRPQNTEVRNALQNRTIFSNNIVTAL